MANSSLATYRNITANNSGKRTAKLCKITPHYMADNGAFSGKGCADYFVQCAKQGRQASSNYCIGGSGDIAVSVDEDCRSWCSSSEWNDQRAATIEVSTINNQTGELTAAAYKALVALCADICKRNGITPHYDGTINGSITMHKQFASTACPGPWLEQKIKSGQFEKDIKTAMGQATSSATPAADTSNGAYESYSGYARVTYGGSDGLALHSKASWDDSTICGTVKKGEVFTIVGRQKVGGVYLYKLKSGKWITSSTKYIEYLKSLPTKTAAKKSLDEIAREVLAGKWGNGADRKNKLTAAGYDYNAVQARVNQLLG